MEALRELAGIIWLVAFVENVIFYGGCLFLLVVAARLAWRRTIGGMALAVLLVAMVAAPFVYYAYLAREDERDIARAVAALASVERHPVAPAERPDTIVIHASHGRGQLGSFLVGTGLFRLAYGEFNPREWFEYRPRAGDGCPVPYDAKPARPARYGNAVDECVERTRVESPPDTGPYISYLFDENAEARRLTSFKNMIYGSVLELRWSPDKGGDLIDLWQRPYFRVLSFPPVIAGGGFLRNTYTPMAEDRSHDPKPMDFLLNAVGLPAAAMQDTSK